MRITVTRSGGFAGLVRRAEVDTADRPELDALVDRIDLDALPEHRPQPDRFVYEIRIGDRSAEVGEADLAGPLRELVSAMLG